MRNRVTIKTNCNIQCSFWIDKTILEIKTIGCFSIALSKRDVILYHGFIKHWWLLAVGRDVTIIV